MRSRVFQVFFQKLARRIPGLVRIESFYVQKERSFLVVFLQPRDRLARGLFHQGVSVLQPALAVRRVLIQERAKVLTTAELNVQRRLIQILSRIQIQKVRQLARSLAVIVNFLPTHPVVITIAPMEITSRPLQVWQVGDQRRQHIPPRVSTSLKVTSSL